jgi:hypothetical protein
LDSYRRPSGKIFIMDTKRIKEIEEEIAEIKARFPAHSVPPRMWQQLEELEEKLEKAKSEPTAK